MSYCHLHGYRFEGRCNRCKKIDEAIMQKKQRDAEDAEQRIAVMRVSREQRERLEAIKVAKSVIKDALIVNQLDDDTERGLEALYDAGMLRKAGGE